VVVNQLVMNKPLDQMRSTGVNAPNRTSKLVNKSEFNGSILNRLMNFARSVPDFRRSDKGNIRHRLADIIILMILARECGCVGRADIIEFGRLHLNNASSG
ncbi:transposase family protein, partial [Paramuribaculum intestinale]|uniref:transposase family protein n=1 Tax=Paramuribaculum intestinale TaxID=2094151 RepID=UPI0025B72692